MVKCYSVTVSDINAVIRRLQVTNTTRNSYLRAVPAAGTDVVDATSRNWSPEVDVVIISLSYLMPQKLNDAIPEN